MDREDIYDGITDVRDDLVEQADKQERKDRKPRRSRWIAGLAAMLAVAVLAGTALRPGGRYSGGGDSGGPADGSDAGGTVSTAMLAAHAISEASYPAMPAYPREEDLFNPKTGEMDDEAFDRLYMPWHEAQMERVHLPEGYAAGLEGFFENSIRQFLGGAEGENRVYSPVNLLMALAMQAELTEGNSREQILDLLGQDSVEALRTQVGNIWKANYCDDGATTSVLANSLWLNESVEFIPETMETLARDYYASSYRGEMGTEEFDQALRDWINQQTGGLLEEQAADLSLDPETVLALASTIYFRGKWSSEFSPSRTEPEIFHAPDGDVECDFMHQSGGTGTYYWGDRFSAAYKSLDNYAGSMYFLLPDEGVTAEELLEDPQVMEFLLMVDRWEGWENRKDLIVNLSLPKFDVSSDLDLIEGLQALGITDIFDPTVSDFTPMTRQVDGIYLSRAEHAARVAVDEEGVTAAAFTVMADAGSGTPPEEEVDFVLDRPFLFAIIGVDGLPLFVGVVNQPG